MKKTILSIATCFAIGGLVKAQVNYQLSSATFDGVEYSSIAFADIDNDGDQDVLITGNYISKLYANNGSGSFTEVTGTPFDGVDQSSITFADVDGDNDQDVLITGHNGSAYISKLYTNDGSGGFTEVTGTPFVGVFRSSIAFADVDGDSDQDVLITGHTGSGNISKLYINNGSGSFTEDTGTPFAGVYYSSIAFADVDNDGDQDVLITGNYISKLYKNNGSGSFTEVTGTPFEGVSRSSIAFADIDNDGDQDVLITGWNDTFSTSKLYTNNGSGVFTEATLTPFDVVNSSSIAFADVDGDNDQDVLITGLSGFVKISKLYANNGLGSFTEVTGTPFEAVSNSSIAFADVDGDSDQDVLITGSTSSGPVSNLYILCEATAETESYTGCQGDGYSVTVNGTVYNEANPTGTDTLTNVAGCDSVITINLVFNPFDITTSMSGETITANLTGANYQWINCSNNYPIAGETAQSFTATANGNYAVIVSNGSCSDTSACTTINSTSINKKTISFSIVPNPTNGMVNIETDAIINSIEVFSMTGQKIHSSTEKTIDLSEVKSGVYFVKVSSEKGTATKKIIKK